MVIERDNEADPGKSRLLVRGFELLFAMGKIQNGVRLVDLCTTSGLSRATVIRILRTLLDLQAVSYDGRERRYRLGPAIERLGASANQSNDLPRVAQPYLDALRDETGETICIFKRARRRRVCVASSLSLNELGFRVLPGQTRELLAGAPGRMIVAHMSVSERQSALAGLSPEAREFNEREFEIAQRERILVSHDEIVVGGTAIAAPIFHAPGRSEDALTLLGPTVRLSPITVLRLLPLVADTASKISMAIGFRSSQIDSNSPHMAKYQ